MKKNQYYTEEIHGKWEIFKIQKLPLVSGRTLMDVNMAYTVNGKLNSQKNNLILVPTWYSGTSRIIEDAYIGKGRALDPDKYCIVTINQIGNGISSSPSNTPAPFNMVNFPNIQIADDVIAQHILIQEVFGVEKIALVVGGSMGAQQTYEWAVRYSEMVERAAPIAGYAKNTIHDFLYTQTLMDAITSDPGWNKGWYTENSKVHHGLRRHARLWSVMGFCTDFFAEKGWEIFGFSSVEDFEIGFMEALFSQMDPNNLLTMAWKWQRGDVSRDFNGDLQKALNSIQAKVYVMPIDSDMFFKVKDCEREQKMIKNSELRVIKSLGGHLGLFGFEKSYLDSIDQHLKELLAT